MHSGRYAMHCVRETVEIREYTEDDISWSLPRTWIVKLFTVSTSWMLYHLRNNGVIIRFLHVYICLRDLGYDINWFWLLWTVRI